MHLVKTEKKYGVAVRGDRRLVPFKLANLNIIQARDADAGVKVWIPSEMLPNNLQSRLTQVTLSSSASLKGSKSDDEDEADDGHGGGDYQGDK